MQVWAFEVWLDFEEGGADRGVESTVYSLHATRDGALAAARRYILEMDDDPAAARVALDALEREGRVVFTEAEYELWVAEYEVV